MNKIFLLFFITFLTKSSFSQIPKTTIVEHFTNSNCGVCAYNNPFIFDTLNNYPNVLRIAFYPSSPYASCFFSLLNPVDNDARTNYYNVYGGTPKLIVNGSLTTLANLNNKLLATTLDSTNFELRATQEYITNDSVLVNVIIKKIAFDTTTQALLFAGAQQDTVMQVTGNGEAIHQDVFRKSLSNITGDLVALPAMINDSLVLNFQYKISNTWVAHQMNAIAILQHVSDKVVINSALSSNVVSIPTVSLDLTKVPLKVFPNPVNSSLFVTNWSQYSNLTILTLDGKFLCSEKLNSSYIDVTNIANGIYLLKLTGKDKHANAEIIIQH